MVKKTPGNVTSLRGRGGQPYSSSPAPSSMGSGGRSLVPAVRAAQDAAAAADGAVRVAEARLREALDAAPRVSPRVAAAENAAEAARGAAQKAAQRVQAQGRAVADAEGSVEAAAAAHGDLVDGDSHGTPGTPSRVVAARVTVEKRTRALTAARALLVDSEETRAGVEAELGAAEDHLGAVRGQAPAEPAAVVLARVGVEKAHRDLDGARQDLVDVARVAAGARAPAAVVPEFASVDAFVEDYVLLSWRHRLVGGRWCATWWRHAEAVARLEAVWEAFEVMRRDPAPALSTWWRDHLDPHMRALTAEEGTFAGCTATRHETVHQQQEPWATQPAPEGTFHTDADSPRQPRRVTHAAMKEA